MKSKDFKGRYGGEVLTMTPTEWHRIQDNPIQRDTEERAPRALRNHLSKPCESHREVKVGRYPDGTLVKLDGHTRSLVWSDGRLEAPDVVYATVYELIDVDDAIAAYEFFDSKWAVENIRDKLSGAYRFHQIVATSDLLLKGGIASAINLLFNNTTESVAERIGEIKPELLVMDRLEMTKEAAPAAIIAAVIITLRRHGVRAAGFWNLYGTGIGQCTDGSSDGVDALMRIISDMRSRKRLGSNRNVAQLLCGKAIACCEAWLAGRYFKRGHGQGVHAIDFKKYVDATIDQYELGIRRKPAPERKRGAA